MEDKEKTLKIMSVITLVVGIAYFIEGVIVTAGKIPYFLSGAMTVVTAIFCFLAVEDESKAKTATTLLFVTVVIDLIGVVINTLEELNTLSLGTAVVSIWLAEYMIKLIKEIH